MSAKLYKRMPHTKLVVAVAIMMSDSSWLRFGWGVVVVRWFEGPESDTGESKVDEDELCLSLSCRWSPCSTEKEENDDEDDDDDDDEADDNKQVVEKVEESKSITKARSYISITRQVSSSDDCSGPVQTGTLDKQDVS